MPTALGLKIGELDTFEKRGEFTICVVGCGYEGFICALTFAGVGFRVICTDNDHSLVDDLGRGRSPFIKRETRSDLRRFVAKGQLMTTKEMDRAFSQSDFIIITGSTRIERENTPHDSKVKETCKKIGKTLRKGALVIYADIAGFGFTEEVIKEALENNSGFKVGVDFGLAYWPIKFSDLRTDLRGKKGVRIAALENKSLNSSAIILATITKEEQKRTLNVKTAELASLFATAKLEVDQALANELAVLCQEAKQDYFEVIEFLGVTPRNMVSHPGISEEENRKEICLLIESAENFNIKLRIVSLAQEINKNMIKHAIKLTQNALRNCGKTIRRAKIALLSSTGDIEGKVFTQTTTGKLVERLEAKGARVRLYCPHFSRDKSSDFGSLMRQNLNETVEGTDCMIIVTSQNSIKRLNFKKMRLIMKMPAAIIDFSGELEPKKVEKEGFVYRGLGKGEVKK